MQSQANAITNAIAFSPVFFRMASFTRVVAIVRQVLGVILQRRQLAKLSNSQLADVGISRDRAMAEAARPFWDLPAKQISLNT